MASYDEQNIIPGLGQFMLGNGRRNEPPPGPIGNTGAPVANERRSRSRTNSAEQGRYHHEAKQQTSMQYSGELPHISSELRQTIMSQAHQPAGNFQESPRGRGRGRGGLRASTRGRPYSQSSSTFQPEVDRKRRYEDDSYDLAKRPRTSAFDRGDRGNRGGRGGRAGRGSRGTHQTLHWASDAPPSDAPTDPGFRNTGQRQLARPSMNNHGREQNLHSGGIDDQDDRQSQYVHRSRVRSDNVHAEASHSPRRMRGSIQLINKSVDRDQGTTYSEPTAPVASQATGFMNALRGADITAEELSTAVPHTDSTRKGTDVAVAAKVAIKGEPSAEAPRALRSTLARAHDVEEEEGQDEEEEEEEGNMPKSKKTNSLREAALLKGMTVEKQVKKLTQLLLRERNNLGQAKEKHTRLKEDIVLAKKASRLAEKGKLAAQTAQEEAERATKEAEQAQAEAETAKTTAEEAAQVAIKEKERIAKRLEKVTNDHTYLLTEQDNMSLAEKLAKFKQDLGQRDESIKSLNDKLVKMASASAGHEDQTAELRKVIEKHEATVTKKDRLIEKNNTALQNLKQEVEKLKAQLEEAKAKSKAQSPVKLANTNDASLPDQKKLSKQHKNEINQAHQQLQAEKEEKREIKRTLSTKRHEIRRLEILLTEEKKNRQKVEKRLAKALEGKGQLKERLAKAKGADSDGGDEDESSDASVSTEQDEDEDDDDNDDDDDDDEDEGVTGEESEKVQPRTSSKSRGKTPAMKVKTEQRRSRSISLQKAGHKTQKKGTKVRAQSGRDRKR